MKKIHILLLILSLSLISNNTHSQVNAGSVTIGTGANQMDLSIVVNTTNSTVSISMTGPSTKWFGFGFATTNMANGAYTILGNVNSGNPLEYNQANHSAPILQSTQNLSSITSNTVSGMKTYSFTRLISTGDLNDYTFPITAATINIIWAYGSGTTLAQHSSRGVSAITLTNACNIPNTSLPSVTICPGDSVQVFGLYRNMPGIYYDTLSTAIGCDSVLSQVLALTNTGPFLQPDLIICQGDSTMIFGDYQSQAGIYLDTLSGSNGCDSILSQSLTVEIPFYQKLADTSICSGDSIMIFGNWQSQGGNYYDSLNTIGGCDSVYNIFLYEYSVDTTVNLGGNLLYANAFSTAYQWYDCQTNLPIPGATNFSYQPLQSGTYKVEVFVFQCSEMSSCHQFTFVGIDVINKADIKVNPNPVVGELYINMLTITNETRISIYAIDGRLVKEIELTSGVNTMNLNDLQSGMYLYQIKSDRVIIQSDRLIKQ